MRSAHSTMADQHVGKMSVGVLCTCACRGVYRCTILHGHAGPAHSVHGTWCRMGLHVGYQLKVMSQWGGWRNAITHCCHLHAVCAGLCRTACSWSCCCQSQALAMELLSWVGINAIVWCWMTRRVVCLVSRGRDYSCCTTQSDSQCCLGETWPTAYLRGCGFQRFPALLVMLIMYM